ncbi:ABC transporter ATP-binding protein [Arthrobacter sp. KNU40]|uniref:ABC transporter ATP-binding protein n=1 Tax=Arthrobacter sp. KNU40 TaxID=3447965 RepID=UPI003F623CBF
MWSLSKKYISIDGLVVDFPVKHRAPVLALDHVSLDVAEGEFVAIVGPSGCGKSTLLKVLCGLEEPSGGSVRIEDADPHRLAAGHRLGVSFQDHGLLPWLTVRQNLALPYQISHRRRDDARISELLELIGLEGFADARPAQLSGGMRQRVAIARALILRPDVLLLDEPFGALDAVTRRHMTTELERIWMAEGVTTIFVTHSVEEAVTLADRVVVMTGRPGRIKTVSEIPFTRPRSLITARDNSFHELVDQLTASLDATVAGSTAA